MSKTDEKKIKQAVDLLIDKDTDLTSFFAKDGPRVGNVRKWQSDVFY